MLLGAEDAFGAGATSVLLCDARGDAIREQHHLRTLLARRVDGIVILGRTTNPRPSITQGIPVPVVYAYAPSDDDADTSFTPDNYLAGKLAVEHLLDRGRTSIALVNGEPSYTAATDRAAGASDAMAARGLSLREATASTANGARVGGAKARARYWIRACPLTASSPVPTRSRAACSTSCANRICARRTMSPSSASTTGTSLAEASRPPLTSIDMQLQDLGRAAARALSTAIGGASSPGVNRLPVRVVPRESTASV